MSGIDQLADVAKYETELNAAVQRLLDKWCGVLSYPAMVRGIVNVMSRRIKDFTERVG